jgi:chromosome segregation ATPase
MGGEVMTTLGDIKDFAGDVLQRTMMTVMALTGDLGDQIDEMVETIKELATKLKEAVGVNKKLVAKVKGKQANEAKLLKLLQDYKDEYKKLKTKYGRKDDENDKLEARLEAALAHIDEKNEDLDEAEELNRHYQEALEDAGIALEHANNKPRPTCSAKPPSDTILAVLGQVEKFTNSKDLELYKSKSGKVYARNPIMTNFREAKIDYELCVKKDCLSDKYEGGACVKCMKEEGFHSQCQVCEAALL